MTTVCVEPGCPRDAVRRGRCAQHQPFRPSTAERGCGGEYQRRRRRFLKRHPTCACGEPATTVHHTRHDAAAPAGLDERYWQPACLSCNSSEAGHWSHRPGAAR